MRTTVVNLRNSEYDVYIGRAGKGQAGYFGNPVKVGHTCPECGSVHNTGGSTLECFQVYFINRVAKDKDFYDRLKELKGKRLGCFCKPSGCHGDVIAYVVNSPLFWKVYEEWWSIRG